MKLTFVSNYLNHHQIPVSNRLYQVLGNEYHFIQTEPMEEERIRMGWNSDTKSIPYLLEYYENPEFCQTLIEDSDLVIFGGVEDEKYIENRLAAGKIIIRISERIYREGQWKAISPRGLRKKYKDHIQYRNKNVYLLCAGGYVASDFNLIKAYPDKMFQWGYFPEFISYENQELENIKNKNTKPRILWAGRMIELKHPEHAIETAEYLKSEKLDFSMTFIGDGPLKPMLRKLVIEKGLEEYVEFQGFLSPAEVRTYMQQADIFLFTSNFREGWGAVLNEAMNSGCAVVANAGSGAVPFLVENGKNAFVYKNKDTKELFMLTSSLVRDREKCRSMGMAGYETIATLWNPEKSADKLLELCYNLQNNNIQFQEKGPLSKAKIISPWKMYDYIKNRK